MERIKKALERARAEAAPMNPHSVEQYGAVLRHAEPLKHLRPGVVSPVQPAALKRYRIIARDKRDPRTAAFDLLRTHVLRGMQQNGWRSLGVTSPTSACGKTTVAINLAMSIAQQTTPNVLLADFDLRRPKVCEYLGLTPEHDLSDFLDERAPFSSTVVDPGVPGLLVIPNRGAYDNATEMLMKPEVRDLVLRLKSEDKRRLLILDLAPVLNTDDTIAFCRRSIAFSSLSPSD
jgi:protein-tyrosine kinase